MKRIVRTSIGIIALFMWAPTQSLSAAEPTSGWRGNSTDLWPDANPQLNWQRTPRGTLDGLRATADWPKDKEITHAPHIDKGLIRDWLVVGPFAVDDSVKCSIAIFSVNSAARWPDPANR